MKVLQETKLENLQKKYGLIGTSDEIKDVVRTIEQVAPTDISVLIEGESGTGKELVVRALHADSPRSSKPLIVVNGGAIPEGLIESELFGHVKGSFTGAVTDRKGFFEEADGGTIFLDEVGEMPLNTQVKLLRVLEQKEFQRVGSAETISVDVRIVAATNRALQALVNSGDFRRDLYYRLKSVNIILPPLRTRSEDIEILAQLFTIERAESLNITFGGFTEDAMEMLKSYEWPGNVRELKNLMESLIVLEKGKVITGKVLQKYLSLDVNIPSSTSENLPVHLDKSAATAERELIIRTLFSLRTDITEIKEMLSSKLMLPSTFNKSKTSGLPFSGTMEEATIVSEPKEVGNISMREMEKDLIRSTLEKFYGNRRKTAEALEISERTLYRKIKDYEI
ncbi:MAG: sigma-54-dependent Fis family transcriptional regulator [Candidatus Marinimicrobia bacterium]|nr:sigma-54-dependent Fis family transcriptional regulator [Candidatus Neomarinimicrobiota bacterium]MCH7954893.1 sigma-54-dependent Fis family transcriptional regulator [Candidatus Neomarinimicrobiota bacterium]